MTNKTMMFYWGCNKPLSYMRYQSIRSFALLNPDWKVTVCVPRTQSPKQEFEWDTREQSTSNPTVDHMWRFITPQTYLSNIKIHVYKPSDFDESFQAANEIHRSDMFRYWWLANEGGFYSDTDILYINPMSVITDSIPDEAEAYLCPNKLQEYQPIGFLGCKKDAALFKRAFKISGQVSDKGYQSYGRYVLETALCLYPAAIYDMPYESVYPVDNLEMMRLLNARDIPLKPNTIGIHWFGGDVMMGEYETRLLKENIEEEKFRFLFKLMEKVQ